MVQQLCKFDRSLGKMSLARYTDNSTYLTFLSNICFKSMSSNPNLPCGVFTERAISDEFCMWFAARIVVGLWHYNSIFINQYGNI